MFTHFQQRNTISLRLEWGVKRVSFYRKPHTVKRNFFPVKSIWGFPYTRWEDKRQTRWTPHQTWNSQEKNVCKILVELHGAILVRFSIFSIQVELYCERSKSSSSSESARAGERERQSYYVIPYRSIYRPACEESEESTEEEPAERTVRRTIVLVPYRYIRICSRCIWWAFKNV